MRQSRTSLFPCSCLNGSAMLEPTRLFAVFSDDGLPRFWGKQGDTGIAIKIQECLERYGSANLLLDKHITKDHRYLNGDLQVL